MVRLSVDAATEALTVTDLGPGIGDQIYLSPDASYVVIAATSGWGARNLSDGQDRWTLVGHTPGAAAPVFVGSDVVFADSDIVGVDARTGMIRWSVPLAGQRATQLALSGDALVANSSVVANGIIQKQGVVVIAPDHTIRFAQRSLPPGGPLLSDGQGHLLSGSISLTLADATLHAPATVCSRVDCGVGAVDLASDPANCGGCGVTCTTGSCQFGMCL
jgi:hypothetical protein